MLQIRKLLCNGFGFLSIVFFLVSLSSGPSLLISNDKHGLFHAHASAPRAGIFGVFFPGIFVVLTKLVFAIPSVLGVLYAMAWWTVKRGRPSARGWSLVASYAVVVLAIPFLIVSAYAFFLIPRSYAFGLVIFDAWMLALGVSGVIAFRSRDALLQIPVTRRSKARRIAFDGTSDLVDKIVGGMQFAGYCAGMWWFQRWGAAQHLPVLRGFWFWFLVALAMLAAISVHELGHAVAGMALGMKVRAFIVGPLQWRIRDGKWKFLFHAEGILGEGGATGIVSSNPEQSRWRDIGMISAGPLTSLLTGEAAFRIALSAKGSVYEPFWQFFAALTTICLVAFGANLIPIRPKGSYSDGARIYQLLRGGHWADLHRAYSMVSSTQVTSMRPRDYDVRAIRRASFP